MAFTFASLLKNSIHSTLSCIDPSIDHSYTCGFAKDIFYSSNSILILLKDIPMPLFYLSSASAPVSSLKIEGILALAEQTTCTLSRSVVVDSDYTITLEQSIAPLKIFYALVATCTTTFPALLSFGPAIEPILMEISRISETLSAPSLDLSPGLGWWDRLRLLVHGSIRFHFPGDGEIRLLLSGTHDPYFEQNVRGCGTTGLEIGWKGNVKVNFGRMMKEYEKMSFSQLYDWNIMIDCDEAIWAIPLGFKDAATKSFGERGKWIFEDWFKQNYRMTRERVLLKASGGVQYRFGMDFTNESLVHISKEERLHSRVQLLHPESIPAHDIASYDAYKHFRTDTIRAYLTIKCSTRMADMFANFNALRFTPSNWTHIKSMISRYRRPLLYKIRRGSLFSSSTRKAALFSESMRSWRIQLCFRPVLLRLAHQGERWGLDKDGDGILEFTQQMLGLQIRAQRLDVDVSLLKMEPLVKVEGLRMRKKTHWVLRHAQVDAKRVEVETLSTIKQEEVGRLSGKITSWVSDCLAWLYYSDTHIKLEPSIDTELLLKMQVFAWVPRLTFTKRSTRALEIEPLTERKESTKVYVQMELGKMRMAELDNEIVLKTRKLRKLEEEIQANGKTELIAESKGMVEVLTSIYERKRALQLHLQKMQHTAVERMVLPAGCPKPKDHSDSDCPRFIAHNMHVIWKVEVRDVLFQLAHRQDQSSALKHYLSPFIFKQIEQLISGKRIEKKQSADGDKLLEKLVNERETHFVVEAQASPQREELKGEFSVNYFVELVNPQLVFQSTSEWEDCGGLVVGAESMFYTSLSYYEEGVREMIKTRDWLDIGNAQFLTYFENELKEGHMIILPIECFSSNEVPIAPFERIVKKSSVKMEYERHNPLYIRTRQDQDMSDLLLFEFEKLAMELKSRQFHLLSNITMNLLLYREPAKREMNDKLESFLLAAHMYDLSTAGDVILALQEAVREYEQYTRDDVLRLKGIAGNVVREEQLSECLENQENLTIAKSELLFLVEALKLYKSSKRVGQLTRKTKVEVKEIEWLMALDDEQPLCWWKVDALNFVLVNYPNGTKANHFEVQRVYLENRLQKPHFVELITPYLAEGGEGNERKAISIHWRELPPVGGISVIEYVEMNMQPLLFQMTYRVGKTLIRYLFVEKTKGGERQSAKSTSDLMVADSAARFPLASEIKQMKDRATNNRTFHYVKITQVTHCISYKGKKAKNIEDLYRFVFKMPELEYRNKTWTLLEFLMQIKKDMMMTVLSHTGSLVKEKLLRKKKTENGQEERKSLAPSIDSSKKTSPMKRFKKAMKRKKEGIEEGVVEFMQLHSHVDEERRRMLFGKK